VVTPDKVSPAEAVNQIQVGSLFTNQNLILTAIILLFALLALGLLYLIVCRDHREPFELRIFMITILVFGSLLVAAAGFGKDQLTPLIGFFGTIAGYILGRGELLEDRPKKREGSDERS
jgi:CHASE2 domain-containing sensor protein